jgi:hypothetical protein
MLVIVQVPQYTMGLTELTYESLLLAVPSVLFLWDRDPTAAVAANLESYLRHSPILASSPPAGLSGLKRNLEG